MKFTDNNKQILFQLETGKPRDLEIDQTREKSLEKLDSSAIGSRESKGREGAGSMWPSEEENGERRS